MTANETREMMKKSPWNSAYAEARELQWADEMIERAARDDSRSVDLGNVSQATIGALRKRGFCVLAQPYDGTPPRGTHYIVTW